MSTRDRLLQEALTVFAQRGYDGATIGEIARKAGVAEGTIYRHFESKKELFVACLEPAVARAAEEISRGAAEAKTLREMARTIVATRFRLMQEDKATFNILFTSAIQHPELSDLLVNRILLGAWQQAEPRIAALEAAGQLRKPPNFFIIGVGMTAAIWAMLTVRENMAALQTPPALPNWTETLVDDLTDFVLYGITGQPTGGETP